MPGRSRLAPEMACRNSSRPVAALLALRLLSAQPELVLDRGLALVVRGAAGADGDLGHGVNPRVLSALAGFGLFQAALDHLAGRLARQQGRGRIGCRGARG